MKDGRGFSLLETVLALALFALVFALAFPLLGLQKRLWIDQESWRDELRTLDAAMGWLTRDLQQAGYHSAKDALLELEEETLAYVLSRDGADPSSFSPGNRRLVTVTLRGEDLMYRIQAWDPSSSTWNRGSTHTLASGLKALRFRGMSRMGAPCEEPRDASAVEITFVGRRAGRLQSIVGLRNLRR